MAEYMFKKLVKEQGLENNFEIDSAATSREEIGNDIYPPAKKCLMLHNVPFERHFARQITRNDIDYYGYILAMEDFNINNLTRMFGLSNKIKRLLDFTDSPRNISDPWCTGDFEKAYSEIEEGVLAFLRNANRKTQE